MDQRVQMTKSMKSVPAKILPQWLIFLAENLGYNKGHIRW